MNRTIFLLVIFLLTETSCSDNTKKHKFIGDKQVPVFNDTSSRIIITGLDNVIKDSGFCASIFQTNSNYKIIAAYIGSDKNSLCDFSKSLVDTASKAINNCAIALLTQSDSAIFCLTPTIAKQFRYKLAVLSVDKNSTYYLDTLDLKFDAIEKANP